MAVYFVETSALAKRYIAETGSVWLRALLDPSTGCSIYVVRVTAVEIIAAITRRERGRTLAPTDATTARQAFRGDLASAYQVIEVTPALANRAMLLAEQHGLRGYDAIQLAAGLEVHVRYVAAGLSAIDLQKMNWKMRTGLAEQTGVSLKKRFPNHPRGGYTREHEDTAQSCHRQRPPQSSSVCLSAR